MSESRPYKKTPEKVAEELNELRNEVRESKKVPTTEKTIIREEAVPTPKTESDSEREKPKREEKKEDKGEDEDKETLDDIKKEDRYKASAG